jgi:hypothetical protein
MTVGELLEILRDIPPDRWVVMARDDEGSDFSPLFDVGLNTSYVAETESVFGKSRTHLYRHVAPANGSGARR